MINHHNTESQVEILATTTIQFTNKKRQSETADKTMIRHYECSTLKHEATEVQNSFVDQLMKLEPPHVLSPRTGESATLEKTFMLLMELPMLTMKRHSPLLRVGHQRSSATTGITATHHA
ncbi:hypothetical protein Bca101_068562 [Brassica carinata]